jgi:hypothetical protein
MGPKGQLVVPRIFTCISHLRGNSEDEVLWRLTRPRVIVFFLLFERLLVSDSGRSTLGFPMKE